MKSDLIDCAVQLHHETEKAWLVSDDGERDHAVWIPKSQAEQLWSAMVAAAQEEQG